MVEAGALILVSSAFVVLSVSCLHLAGVPLVLGDPVNHLVSARTFHHDPSLPVFFSGMYPPLVRVVTHVFYSLCGESELSALASSVSFMFILAPATYCAVRKLANQAAAWLATILVLLSPYSVVFSQEYYLEFAEGAMLALVLCSWVLSEGFSRRAMGVLCGVALGLGLLTKWNFVPVLIILVPPMLRAVWTARRDWRVAVSLLGVANHALFTFAAWYEWARPPGTLATALALSLLAWVLLGLLLTWAERAGDAPCASGEVGRAFTVLWAVSVAVALSFPWYAFSVDSLLIFGRMFRAGTPAGAGPYFAKVALSLFGGALVLVPLGVAGALWRGRHASLLRTCVACALAWLLMCQVLCDPRARYVYPLLPLVALVVAVVVSRGGVTLVRVTTVLVLILMGCAYTSVPFCLTYPLGGELGRGTRTPWYVDSAYADLNSESRHEELRRTRPATDVFARAVTDEVRSRPGRPATPSCIMLVGSSRQQLMDDLFVDFGLDVGSIQFLLSQRGVYSYLLEERTGTTMGMPPGEPPGGTDVDVCRLPVTHVLTLSAVPKEHDGLRTSAERFLGTALTLVQPLVLRSIDQSLYPTDQRRHFNGSFACIGRLYAVADGGSGPTAGLRRP